MPRPLLTFALVLAVTVLVLAAQGAGWLAGLDRLAWDARARLLARTAPDDLPIRLVLVDEPSLAERPWPWPRKNLARVVELCKVAGCKALAFDLLMPDPDLCHHTDTDFAAALAEARRPPALPVALAVATSAEPDRDFAWPDQAPHPLVADLAGWREAGGDLGELTRLGATFPHPPLAREAAGFGHVDGSPEGDATVRRVAALRLFDGDPLPPLGIATWALTRPRPHGALPLALDVGALTLDDRRLPLDAEGRLMLRFRRPRTDLEGHLYPTLSATRVVAAAEKLAGGRSLTISEDDPETTAILDHLRDAYVIFGYSAPALHDNQSTPVAPLVPGAALHATLLDNLLGQENGHGFLRPAPPWATLLMVLLGTLLGVAVTFGLRRAASHRPGRLALALFLLLVPGGVALLAHGAGSDWPITAPTLATLLGVASGGLAGYALEGRRRRFLRRAFEHYLSPAVVERLVEEPGRLSLGGERRNLSLFFSDLAGFSTFSERLDPRQLTALLNHYLGEMSQLLLTADATLDKYEGDAIVAFWNAPLDQGDHALRACRTALLAQRRLAELAPEVEERWGVRLSQRIGIATGAVVVGNLGSPQRFDYSVMGDAANLAARLEGVNKVFGSQILVSAEAWEGVGDALVGRRVADVIVVGRSQPTSLWEPLALADEPPPPWLDTYHRNLDQLERANYSHQAIEQAHQAFTELTDHDPVSRAWAEKLASLEKEASPWDGVWRLRSK